MIKLIKSDGNVMIFNFEGSKELANAFRRTIITEVPTMAVEDVEIFKNSSAMFDETLASRLGLMPLFTDLESYNLPERCTCNGEGCMKCSVKLYLKGNKQGMVYASSIESKDPAIIPVYEKMPLVWLNTNHNVELELTAKLGKGKTHAKHSPGLVYFKKVQTAKLKDAKDADKLLSKCPADFVKIKGTNVSVVEQNAFEHDLDDCLDLNDDFMTIEDKENNYLFYLESWGQLKPKDILLSAVNELQIKTKEFESELKKLK